MKGKKQKIAHSILELESKALGQPIEKLSVEGVIESPTRFFYDIVIEGGEKLRNRHLSKPEVMLNIK